MSEETPTTPPTKQLPPAAHPFPGSLTPGWNDPPSIQYSSQMASSGGRTKLNKRVPFPLQQQGLTTTTTKPTAIVQPCQTTTISSNIAVVHPMQYSNNGTPPAATLPASTIGSQTTFPRESPTPPPSSFMSGLATVPTMSVPAVPRQNSGESSTGSFTSPSIHHI